MGSTRIHRLLQLITLLQGPQALNAQRLAAALGVSRRTLFRDLSALSEAGIPYFREGGQGYRLARTFFLPPISLTVTETLGLMLLGKSAAAQRNRPLTGAALSAIAKLTATVPDPIRQACREMMDQVSVDPGAQLDQPCEQNHYLTLQRCIDERRCCQLRYQSRMADEPEPMEISLRPWALHFAARAWYVLGHSDAHGEVRMFKLGRILDLQPTDRRFKRPENFDVRQKLGKAWQLIPEGKLYKVELRFAPKVAVNAGEVRWHETQQTVFHDDGSCTMSFEVDGLGEIAWWVCGYADQVRVLKPKALRDRVAGMLQNAIKQYQ